MGDPDGAEMVAKKKQHSLHHNEVDIGSACFH